MTNWQTVDYDDCDSEGPGPGAYTIESRTLGGPAFSLGARRARRQQDDGPGPGQYDYHTRRSEAGATLKGRSTQANLSNDTPGPNSYSLDPPRLVGGPKGFSMTSRRSYQREHATPGPGMYETERVYSCATPKDNVATLKSRRGQNFDLVDSPGPGAYAPEDWEQRGMKYTMSGRRHALPRKSDEPGPGQYTLPSKIGGNGFAITGRSRRNRRVVEHMARADDR